jgi:hypothetical protein
LQAVPYSAIVDAGLHPANVRRPLFSAEALRGELGLKLANRERSRRTVRIITELHDREALGWTDVPSRL